MTLDHATLRSLAMTSHYVDDAFLAAYHADLSGDAAQAADRYKAGVVGLKRLLRMAAEAQGETVDEAAESEEQA